MSRPCGSERKLERSDRSHRSDREMSASMMQEKIDEIRENMDVIRKHMHEVAVRQLATRLAPVIPSLAPLAEKEEPAPPVPPGPEPSDRRRPRPGTREDKVLQILKNESNIIESNRNQISRYGVEIHKKFSIPLELEGKPK